MKELFDRRGFMRRTGPGASTPWTSLLPNQRSPGKGFFRGSFSRVAIPVSSQNGFIHLLLGAES